MRDIRRMLLYKFHQEASYKKLIALASLQAR